MLIFEMGIEKDLSRIVYKRGDSILTLVRPHGGHKHCHWLDVKDVIKILEED